MGGWLGRALAELVLWQLLSGVHSASGPAIACLPGPQCPEAMMTILKATIGTRRGINTTLQLSVVQIVWVQPTLTQWLWLTWVPDLGIVCFACRASKAALNIINKALVMDLSEQKVDCVLMHPGYVKTDMTGLVAPGNDKGTAAADIGASYCSRIMPMPRLVLTLLDHRDTVCCWQVVQDMLKWRRV